MQEKRDSSPSSLTHHDAPPTHDSHPLATPPPAPSPPSGPPPPPNGGPKAWLHVAGSFMLYFNTWGIMNAFGVYQTYYESGALFTTSSSSISWVGSISAFLLLAMGVVAGPVYDRGHLRFMLVFGTFMVVFGHMMLSLCSAYWQVVLAQGVVVGVGAGVLFVPCVAILPQYFSTQLGTALGVAAAGSALGGVIYPIVLFRLIGSIGFPWAVRVVGFIALGTLIVPIAVLEMRVQPPKVRAAIDMSAFADLYYVAFVIVTLVAYTGLFVIFFYLPYFAEATHITNHALATYLVPIFNSASLFGRTLPNMLADRTGPLNLLAPAAATSGVLMLCMMAVRSQGAVIVVALLSGFVSGALIGLPPLGFVALTRDKSKLGTRIGQGYALVGLGVLASGPSAGAVLGVGERLDWQGLWAFGGVCTVVAGVGYAGLRVARYGVGMGKA
ncbi:major facilitator superfamily domain-containing protein [Massariosphaeria phaeospora]|uniref:Major facilitator superfamily domain-containing protein n=1 Tax=Massariosphaeria phaeospora TaxID=100035 RepID=A0A7C8IAI2_9PLEO|nr:major facilitator superfamily domain-containing protein [Massariosphaeria phaeospora]